LCHLRVEISASVKISQLVERLVLLTGLRNRVRKLSTQKVKTKTDRLFPPSLFLISKAQHYNLVRVAKTATVRIKLMDFETR
jgi:hypothetical protein